MQNLTVHFIDVGQGDSILISTPAAKAVLIDGGPGWASDTVASYLGDVGIDELDVVIATHPDADHIGGLLSVLSNDSGIEVGRVYDNGAEHDSATYDEYIALLAGYEHTSVADDSKLELDGFLDMDLIVPYDTAGYSSSSNDDSVLLRVVYNDVAFLFTGDCGESCESCVQDAELDADILKVPHHGSNAASSGTFLSRVTPEVAVISVGENNTYRHPHPDAVERLEGIGAVVYRTDRHGNVVVTSDGTTYSIRTEKTAPTAEATPEASPGTTPEPTAEPTPNATAEPTPEPTSILTPSPTPTEEPKESGVPGADDCQWVASRTSELYHFWTCSYVDNINEENIVCFTTEEEAIGSGRRRCKKE